MPDLTLEIEPLTARAFAPFGDVIETTGNACYPINDGMVDRYHDLATVDIGRHGRPGISLMRATPYRFPWRVRLVERHPLSSQAFIPLSSQPFLVIAAAPGDDVCAARLKAFITDGTQGVNYHAGAWHHPLLTFGAASTFAVVDRIGEGTNCDLHHFAESDAITIVF